MQYRSGTGGTAEAEGLLSLGTLHDRPAPGRRWGARPSPFGKRSWTYALPGDRHRYIVEL